MTTVADALARSCGLGVIVAVRCRAVKQPCLYILAGKRHGALYVGVTSDVIHRVGQHRNDQLDGFTKRYGIHRLVYYEFHGTMADAIVREKRVKRWRRAWKVRLIEETNPDWRDLYEEILH